MESAFDRALARVFAHEGGFSDVPADRGGRTRFGITERVARANGYQGPMDHLPVEWATRIYKAQYWDTLRLDALAQVDEDVAAKLFDIAVNMGVAAAGAFLQRLLNALNRQGKDFGDLVVDGLVGPVTIAAFRAFSNHRGSDGSLAMLAGLRGLQAARYIAIAEADASQETFTFGWLRRAA